MTLVLAPKVSKSQMMAKKRQEDQRKLREQLVAAGGTEAEADAAIARLDEEEDELERAEN